jgi:hypothetical protein
LASNSREFGVCFGAVQVEAPFSRELQGFLGRVFTEAPFCSSKLMTLLLSISDILFAR